MFSSAGLRVPGNYSRHEDKGNWTSCRAHVFASSAIVGREQDRDILRAFYNALGGSSRGKTRTWTTERPLSEWDGVELDESGRVTTLALYEVESHQRRDLAPDLGGIRSIVARCPVCLTVRGARLGVIKQRYRARLDPFLLDLFTALCSSIFVITRFTFVRRLSSGTRAR